MQMVNDDGLWCVFVQCHSRERERGFTKTQQQTLTDGDDQSALHANECHCVINVY